MFVNFLFIELVHYFFFTAFRSENCDCCIGFHWTFYGEWIVFQHLPIFERIVSNHTQVTNPFFPQLHLSI